MIELCGIVKTYRSAGGEVQALRGIDLTIPEGEFIAIVGRSGSGKSTLMNILGCLDAPSAGEYILAGRSVAGASARTRAIIRNREIGFIFQGYNLAPRLTALENVTLPLIFRGISQRERLEMARNALDAVGLSDRAGHFPGELSGGQQQRVAIARAIAAKPPLILADEPTGSLDSAAASGCLELLYGLNRAGHTVVLITHDMDSAARAKRVVVLEEGRIGALRDYPS